VVRARCSALDKLVRRAWRSIPHDHLLAAVDQAARHFTAHRAETEETEHD
jgi:hypothetical protein